MDTEDDKGHKEGNLEISKYPQSTYDGWIIRCQGIELFQNKCGSIFQRLGRARGFYLSTEACVAFVFHVVAPIRVGAKNHNCALSFELFLSVFGIYFI